MVLRKGSLSALLVLALSGCTVYESYSVEETRSRPSRPVEVAREGDISSFDKVLVAGADIATAIIAPVAAVAKAAVISVVDVEVNRSKETRKVKAQRWLSTDASAFPGMSAAAGELLGAAALEVAQAGGDGGEAGKPGPEDGADGNADEQDVKDPQ